MKTTGRYLLLFLFLTPTLIIFSQDEEWKWRDAEWFEVGDRVLEQTNYRDFTFKDKADFRSSEFDSTADFQEATFASTASFEHARFPSTATFWYATFASRVTFWFTTFRSAAYFRNSQFDSRADFRDVTFASRADFMGAQFDDYVLFINAKFEGETFFQGVTLPMYLDFSQVTKIANEIDLTKAVINPKYRICYINLTDAAIDKFRFRYKRFKLWFPKTYYDPNTWDSIKEAGYELKSNVYEELLKKQKEEGFNQSYEILDKEYRQFQYLESEDDYWWIMGHIFNWVDKNWWGYGYEKELVLRNVILIYLLLSIINAFFLKYLTTRVYLNKKIEKKLEKQEVNSWLTRTSNSVWYSLFYTAIIFFSLKFDMEKLNYNDNLDGWKKLNLVYFFTIYLGGFVCLAYLANYIITV